MKQTEPANGATRVTEDKVKPRESMMMNRKSATVLNGYLRVFVAAIALLGAFAGTASAQPDVISTPHFELSGAYSYVRANAANSGGAFNLNGGSGSVAYNFSDRFSVVADGGAYRFSGLPNGLDSTMYTYLFGPRMRFHKVSHVIPFAQVLLGGGCLNASSGSVTAGENGFSMAAGGGVDWPLHGHFAVRLVEADYLLTRFNRVDGSSATQNDLRISAGLVFRFGSR